MEGLDAQSLLEERHGLCVAPRLLGVGRALGVALGLGLGLGLALGLGLGLGQGLGLGVAPPALG